MGLDVLNKLQVFAYDIGELLSEHPDFKSLRNELVVALDKADKSPFIQSLTAFQFAKNHAKKNSSKMALISMEDSLLEITTYYHSKIREYKESSSPIK